MLRSALRCAITLLVILGASDARAEPPRRPSARLEYDRKKGAEQCPDEAELRAYVAARLGRDPFTADSSRRVVSTVARKGRGFVGTMDLFENGEKSWSQGPIEDPSCTRLVDEILALAIVINLSEPPAAPPAATSLPASPLAPTPSPPPAEKPTPPVDQPTAAVDPDAPRLRLAFGSGIELGDGPTPSPVFSLNVGVRWPVVSIALEGRTDLPLTGTGASGVQVQTHVVAGAVMMCLHASSLYLYGCGVFAVGVQRGGDVRSPAGYSSTAYAGAGGRGGVEIPVTPRFAVQLTADLLAAINPIAIRSQPHDGDPLREIWRSTPVAGAVQGGLVAFF
ncbi:MAG: hypothetical protein ABJE95_39240 [Byssovorax sp.]